MNLTGASDAGAKQFKVDRDYGLIYSSLELDARATVNGFTCESFIVSEDKKKFVIKTRWTDSKATITTE